MAKKRGVFGQILKAASAPPKRASGSPSRSAPETLVNVVLCELIEEPPPDGRIYLYAWPLSRAPKKGDRVQVASGSVGVVVGMGKRSDYAGSLASVERLVPKAEIDAAHQEDENRFQEARRAAGLPAPAVIGKTPAHLPDLPPATGPADAATAEQYGRIWWRLYKSARTDEEAVAFKKVAQYWYELKDMGGLTGRAYAAHQAKVEAERHYEEAGLIDGQPAAHWKRHVVELKREDRTVEAIKIVARMINATEAQARVASQYPGVLTQGVAVWPYEQLAILFRKMKDADAEAEILERFAQAPKTPSPQATKLAERLEKVRATKKTPEVSPDGR